MRIGANLAALAFMASCGAAMESPQTAVIKTCSSAHQKVFALAEEPPIEFSDQQIESICVCAASQSLSQIDESAHKEYAVQFEELTEELLVIFENIAEKGEGDPRIIAHQISTKSPAKVAALYVFARAYVPCANENGIEIPDPFALPTEPLDEDAGETLEKLLERRD